MKELLLLSLLFSSIVAMGPNHPSRYNYSKSAGNSPAIHPRVLAVRHQNQIERQLILNDNHNLQPVNLLPAAPKLHRSIEIDDLRAVHLSEVHLIDIEAQPMSPEVQAANITAHSSTKVACIALGASLVTAGLTAGVILAIHFTSCN